MRPGNGVDALVNGASQNIPQLSAFMRCSYTACTRCTRARESLSSWSHGLRSMQSPHWSLTRGLKVDRGVLMPSSCSPGAHLMLSHIGTHQFFPGIALYGCTTSMDSPSRGDSGDFLWVGWYGVQTLHAFLANHEIHYRVPILLTETFLFILSAWKLRAGLQRARWSGSQQTLSQVLLRDSCKYYAV